MEGKRMNEKFIEIQWKKCKNCGFLQHNSHLRCLNCKNDEFSIIYPSGLGTLISYTILTAPPKEFRAKRSYALGIIQFSNNIKALGQIIRTDKLKIGMELKPIYKEICNNLDGKKVETYIFEPV
jgi:hypothetical protein